jgi:hypothetical protein
MQVRTLSGMGTRQEDIAIVLQVSVPTLRKYYPRELELGLIEANAKVAQSVFKQATHPTKPNVAAGLFWLKCRAGWREAGGVPLSDPTQPEQPLGKKDQANADAVGAEKGTGWDDLLPKPRSSPAPH